MRGKAAKAGKKILVKGMVDPIPCVICGTMFERYRSDGVKHENCAGCRSKLEEGQVCIISKLTRDGVYDGRYAFLTPDDSPVAQAMVGKVIAVDPLTMTHIILKQRMASLESGYVIEYCPNCHNDEVRKRGDGEPADCLLVQWDCGKCEKKEVGDPKYFDGNMSPLT